MTTLTVVAANGAVYEGERAWVVCAWSLPGWQPVAESLGSRPALLAVRVLARALDRHRRHAVTSGYRPGCDTCGIAGPAQEQPDG